MTPRRCPIFRFRETRRSDRTRSYVLDWRAIGGKRKRRGVNSTGKKNKEEMGRKKQREGNQKGFRALKVQKKDRGPGVRLKGNAQLPRNFSCGLSSPEEKSGTRLGFAWQRPSIRRGGVNVSAGKSKAEGVEKRAPRRGQKPGGEE